MSSSRFRPREEAIKLPSGLGAGDGLPSLPVLDAPWRDTEASSQLDLSEVRAEPGFTDPSRKGQLEA